MKNFFKKQNKGYTLLFAVLVASLVLGIGISILTISKKEFLLSASARDSSKSLYAADSGIECAYYIDSTTDDFSTSTPTETPVPRCEGAASNISAATISNGVYTRTFSIKFGADSDACATIKVEKYYDSDGDQVTSIDSRGYNIGWNSSTQTCDSQSAKKVERSFRLTY